MALCGIYPHHISIIKERERFKTMAMKVEQMINSRGNGAMNQFIIRGEGKMVFQSYSSTIAEIDYNTNTIRIGEDWSYSVTTGKHRNIFFSDYAHLSGLASKSGIEKALKDGEFSNDICTFKVIKGIY